MKTYSSIVFISIFIFLSLFSCKKEDNPEFIYPETVSGTLNVLSENNSVFYEGFDTNYCFSAIAPKGMSLKIKMEYLEGGDLSHGYWGYRLESDTNWKATVYDKKNFQFFEVVESGRPSNLNMSFLAGNGVKIKISYFENNDLDTTRTKIITVY